MKRKEKGIHVNMCLVAAGGQGVSSLKSLIYTSPSPPHPYNNPIFSYLGLAFGPKTPYGPITHGPLLHL